MPEESWELPSNPPGKALWRFATSMVTFALMASVVGMLSFAAFAALGWLTGLWTADHPAAAAAFVVASLSYFAFDAWKRRPSREVLEMSRRDRESGEVDELTFEVAEAKAFRDPEHGMFMYFLKLADARVFFDYFDDRMADEGWEREAGNIPEEKLPGQTLHLLYGTASGNLLATRMSGNKINPVSVNIMKGNPSYWPSGGTFRRTKWDDIEDLFAAR